VIHNDTRSTKRQIGEIVFAVIENKTFKFMLHVAENTIAEIFVGVVENRTGEILLHTVVNRACENGFHLTIYLG
jgi:hypothetical protein